MTFAIVIYFPTTPKLRYNKRSCQAPFVHYIANSLYRDYKKKYRDFLIVKGAGICSLYHEIHYIEIRYIKVWVY